MNNIGIYISAFDPIHEGDLAFARSAIEQTKLDKVYFYVEPRPKNRQGVKALEHRIHMVVLAVKSDPKLGTIVVKSQNSSPVEIAKIINKRFDGQTINVLIPDEKIGRLDHWAWLKIGDVPINLTIGLDKLTPKEVKSHIKSIESIFGTPISSNSFQAPNPAHKATEVRRKLRLGVRPKEVSDPVYDYINVENLYASRSSA